MLMEAMLSGGFKIMLSFLFFRSTPTERYSNFYDLWLPIPAALLVMAMRHFWEKSVSRSYLFFVVLINIEAFLSRHCFRPLGISLGLRATRGHRKAPHNPTLETLFLRREGRGGGGNGGSDNNNCKVGGAAARDLSKEREELLQVPNMT